MCSSADCPCSWRGLRGAGPYPPRIVLARCSPLINGGRAARCGSAPRMIRKLLDEPASPKTVARCCLNWPRNLPGRNTTAHDFGSRASRRDRLQRGLRIDPNSLMRARCFQLIRNVLHGSGTVIALRPEDMSPPQPWKLSKRPWQVPARRKTSPALRIPSIVSMCVSNGLDRGDTGP